MMEGAFQCRNHRRRSTCLPCCRASSSSPLPMPSKHPPTALGDHRAPCFGGLLTPCPGYTQQREEAWRLELWVMYQSQDQAAYRTPCSSHQTAPGESGLSAPSPAKGGTWALAAAAPRAEVGGSQCQGQRLLALGGLNSHKGGETSLAQARGASPGTHTLTASGHSSIAPCKPQLQANASSGRQVPFPIHAAHLTPAQQVSRPQWLQAPGGAGSPGPGPASSWGQPREPRRRAPSPCVTGLCRLYGNCIRSH